MINVQKILYATDFSPYSNQAYFHAVALAEKYEASLAIVHVYTPSAPLLVGPGAGMALAKSDTAEQRDYWRGQLEQIRPVNSDIAVHHVLLVGDPAAEILRCAADTRVDLIVMGTHGRTGLERLLLGSVAEKVLRGAPCSVLVVKMPQAAPATLEDQAEVARSPA